MERWFRSFKYEWMQEGDYLTLGQAMDDVRAYVMYYNFVSPHRYNQGLPPVLTKTTYRELLNLVDHYKKYLTSGIHFNVFVR